MIQLKEALIGKKNAKDAKAEVNDKNVIWVLKSHNTLLDSYLMKRNVKTAKTKDGITLYILTNEELSKCWWRIKLFDSVTMVVKDRSMSMKEVEDYIKNHEYKYKSFNDAFSFEDYDKFISEALIGKNNVKNASSGVVWVEPSSVKDLVPGRVVKYVDDWNTVRDMIALPSETDLKKNGFLSDVILCPTNTKSGYFYHYIDDFMYDGELHRSSGKIIKISKELINVSKIHDIKDVIQLFKIYGLNSEYRSLINNESLIGKHNIDNAESHLNYKSYIIWPFGVNFAKVENDGKFFKTIRLSSYEKVFVYEEKYLKNIIKQLSYDNIEIYGTDIPVYKISDIIEMYRLSDFQDYPEVFHQLDPEKLRHEL